MQDLGLGSNMMKFKGLSVYIVNIVYYVLI